MNNNEIIKALQCCGTGGTCRSCPRAHLDDSITECMEELIKEAHSLVESYTLQYGTAVDREVFLKPARAEAVTKFVERLDEKVCLFTTQGDEQYREGASDAIGWYDEKVEETLKEFTEGSNGTVY